VFDNLSDALARWSSAKKDRGEKHSEDFALCRKGSIPAIRVLFAAEIRRNEIAILGCSDLITT
jgi:hypothetical protein